MVFVVSLDYRDFPQDSQLDMRTCEFRYPENRLLSAFMPHTETY